jgi:hypothetical protein
MAKRRKRGKGKSQKREGTAFPIGLGSVVPPWFIPAAAAAVGALLISSAEREVGGPALFWALVGLAAVLTSIRLPSAFRTILFDNQVVLGPELLHIPIMGWFRFTPRDIPFADIESITTTRESGSSTRIRITMRDGSQVVIPSHYVNDYPTVVKAIERRV